jgi:DNA-binding MarR family transcriptional regulator
MSTFAILDAYSSLRRELSLILAPLLRSSDLGHKQMLILYRLIQSPTSMSELASYCQSDPAATTRTVAALERAGLVKRASDDRDSRKSIIELTKKGRGNAAKAEDYRKVVGAMVNKTLTPEEQAMFIRLTNKVVKGLQDQKIQKE